MYESRWALGTKTRTPNMGWKMGIHVRDSLRGKSNILVLISSFEQVLFVVNISNLFNNLFAFLKGGSLSYIW